VGSIALRRSLGAECAGATCTGVVAQSNDESGTVQRHAGSRSAPWPKMPKAPAWLPQVLPAALIAVIVAVVGATSYYGWQVSRAGSVGFWVILCVPTLALALAGASRAYRDAELGSWLRPIWGDPTRGIVSAAVLVLCAVGSVHVIAAAGSPRESWIARIYLQLGDPTALHDHTLLVAGAVIAMAVAEEVLWRGLVTTLLAETIGTRTAWVYAAVLYALALVPAMWPLRDPTAGLNPLLPLAGLGVGLAWGAMARITGRLVPGILSHAAFDWCVITLFRLWGPSV
jgi:membrane protease YdiL (CAAX protease family)